MLRSEILANRQKVIEFLKQPKRKKGTSRLDSTGGFRCCLGHMCYVLKLPKTEVDGHYAYGKHKATAYAPRELIELLGLYSDSGAVFNTDEIVTPNLKFRGVSLASLNDITKVTPQEIGAYLESVIEGGANTPWRPLFEYPETL